MTFAKTTRTFASRGETTHLTVLVHRITDPVGLGVAADGIVEGVDQDDLEELVGRVLTHPVGVQNTETAATTPDTFLVHRKTVRISFIQC